MDLAGVEALASSGTAGSEIVAIQALIDAHKKAADLVVTKDTAIKALATAAADATENSALHEETTDTTFAAIATAVSDATANINAATTDTIATVADTGLKAVQAAVTAYNNLTPPATNVGDAPQPAPAADGTPSTKQTTISTDPHDEDLSTVETVIVEATDLY